MSIKPLPMGLNSIFGMIAGKEDDMSLTNLESKLFDSVEFCLALMGTIPIPLFVVDKGGKVFMLSAGRFGEEGSELVCAHVKNAEEWCIQQGGPAKGTKGCIFCDTIAKVRKTGQKLRAKGEWKVSDGPGKEPKTLIVTIHAVPTSIKDANFVLVAVEDITELEKLKGLLPICMECNKIHDTETGDWTRIDQYVTERSPAKFSHGLCPQCAEKLLKEIGN